MQILDLHFLQKEETIASFLIPGEAGPILIETGPYSTWEHLCQGLKQQGYAPQDIKHVLLTHIHFDHAGAAWALAERGATVYVHPVGLPHLAAPERLYRSAKRIYGDEMERLWGEMKGIPAEQLVAVEDGQKLDIGGAVIYSLAYARPRQPPYRLAMQRGHILRRCRWLPVGFWARFSSLPSP